MFQLSVVLGQRPPACAAVQGVSSAEAVRDAKLKEVLAKLLQVKSCSYLSLFQQAAGKVLALTKLLQGWKSPSKSEKLHSSCNCPHGPLRIALCVSCTLPRKQAATYYRHEVKASCSWHANRQIPVETQKGKQS